MDKQRVLLDNEQWKIDLDGLVDDAYKDCQEQGLKMERLALWRISQSTFYVKVRSYKNYSRKNQYSNADYEFYILPYFERTRVLTIEKNIVRK